MKLRNAVNGIIGNAKILDESLAFGHFLLFQLQSCTRRGKRRRQTERPAMDHGTLPADRTQIIADRILVDAVAAENLRIFLPQISGEAYTFKVDIEGSLDHGLVHERRQDAFGYTVAVRQIIELHCTVIHCHAHQRDSKIRRIGVSVHTTLGDVTVTPSLQIDFYGFHGNTSLNPPGRSYRQSPSRHCVVISYGS